VDAVTACALYFDTAGFFNARAKAAASAPAAEPSEIDMVGLLVFLSSFEAQIFVCFLAELTHSFSRMHKDDALLYGDDMAVPASKSAPQSLEPEIVTATIALVCLRSGLLLFIDVRSATDQVPHCGIVLLTA
jgi:hypothetical protein